MIILFPKMSVPIALHFDASMKRAALSRLLSRTANLQAIVRKISQRSCSGRGEGNLTTDNRQIIFNMVWSGMSLRLLLTFLECLPGNLS